MQVNPGELKRKIQIIKITAGKDAEGYPTKPKETVIRTCNAKYTVVSGTETVKAGGELSQVKTRFLVRYSDTGIDTTMIVRYKGKDYDIKFINPYEDNKEYIEIWSESEGRS